MSPHDATKLGPDVLSPVVAPGLGRETQADLEMAVRQTHGRMLEGCVHTGRAAAEHEELHEGPYGPQDVGPVPPRACSAAPRLARP
jgi:hypothetical protein